MIQTLDREESDRAYLMTRNVSDQGLPHPACAFVRSLFLTIVSSITAENRGRVFTTTVSQRYNKDHMSDSPFLRNRSTVHVLPFVVIVQPVLLHTPPSTTVDSNTRPSDQTPAISKTLTTKHAFPRPPHLRNLPPHPDLSPHNRLLSARDSRPRRSHPDLPASRELRPARARRRRSVRNRTHRAALPWHARHAHGREVLGSWYVVIEVYPTSNR